MCKQVIKKHVYNLIFKRMAKVMEKAGFATIFWISKDGSTQFSAIMGTFGLCIISSKKDMEN